MIWSCPGANCHFASGSFGIVIAKYLTSVEWDNSGNRTRWLRVARRSARLSLLSRFDALGKCGSRKMYLRGTDATVDFGVVTLKVTSHLLTEGA